jgi:hypothetical protein
MPDAKILPFEHEKMEAFYRHLDEEVLGSMGRSRRSVESDLETSLFKILGGLLPSDPLAIKIRKELGLD